MAISKTGFSVSIEGGTRIKVNTEWLRRQFPVWLAEANMETAREIQAQAMRNIVDIDAYDTEALYNSIVMQESRGGLALTVGSTAKHAPFIEFGTRPHFPPIAPIAAWCERKLGDASAAWAVCKKIAEEGTPPRPFLAPAFKVGMAGYQRRIKEKYYFGAQARLAG